MIIKSTMLGEYQTNCYVIIDKNSKDSVVVDPGDDIYELESFITSNGVVPLAILLTHGHMDHTAGVKFLCEKFNVKVYINKADEELIRHNTSVFGELPNENSVEFLNDNDDVQFGNLKFKVIGTPGHSPGGLCFYIDGVLFSGDTLFYRSIGRSDFLGGNHETLINSILNKLMILSDETVVYCGHGPRTTIGFEKINNDYLY